MRFRRRDAMTFICGRMSEGGLEAFTQLTEQAPRWLDVHLVGFDPDGDTDRPDVVIGRRRYVHRIYDAHDLTDFDFPGKHGRDPDGFRLIPGNTDLLQLRFARDHPRYRRYWSVEDDVRFGGDWSVILEHFRRSDAALIGTTIRRRPLDPKWFWWPAITPPEGVRLPKKTEMVAAFLPFTALTPAAIAAITAGYRAGWRGHYEALWPMLVRGAGLRIQDVGGTGEFVAPGDEGRFYTNSGRRSLAPGTFIFRPHHVDYDRSTDQLWHPVRDGMAETVAP